jgi:hypothetical protein
LCTSVVPHGIPGEFLRSSFLAKKFPENKNEFSIDSQSQGIPRESFRNGNSPGLRIDVVFLGNSFVRKVVVREIVAFCNVIFKGIFILLLEISF